MNDAKDAHAANGGKVDVPVAATAAGVGAIGGGLGAFKGLSKFVPEGGIQMQVELLGPSASTADTGEDTLGDTVLDDTTL